MIDIGVLCALFAAAAVIGIAAWLLLHRYRCPQYTHRSVQNGDWNDPATWGGSVPGVNARVFIGHAVTVSRPDYLLGEEADPTETM